MSVFETLSRLVKVVPYKDSGLFLRTMTGEEADSWRRYLATQIAKGDAADIGVTYATLLAKCLSDSEGARICSDSDVDQIIKSTPAIDLEAMFVEARKLNGVIEREEVDAAKKDSAPTPSSDSGSSSPAP
jgi:hypothetical protein